MGIKEFLQQSAENERDNIRDIRITTEKKTKKKEIEFDLEKDITKEVIDAFEQYIPSPGAVIDDRKFENLAALVILAPEKAEAICQEYARKIERYLLSIKTCGKDTMWTPFFRLLWLLGIIKGKVNIDAQWPIIKKMAEREGLPDIGWVCLKSFYPAKAEEIKLPNDFAKKVLFEAEMYWDALGTDMASAVIFYESLLAMKVLFPEQFQKWIKPRWPKMKRWLKDFNKSFARGSAWQPSFESFAMLASAMRILAADKLEGGSDGLRIIDVEEKFQGEEREPRPVRLSF